MKATRAGRQDENGCRGAGVALARQGSRQRFGLQPKKFFHETGNWLLRVVSSSIDEAQVTRQPSQTRRPELDGLAVQKRLTSLAPERNRYLPDALETDSRSKGSQRVG